jgi:hypothetical protein
MAKTQAWKREAHEERQEKCEQDNGDNNQSLVITPDVSGIRFV